MNKILAAAAGEVKAAPLVELGKAPELLFGIFPAEAWAPLVNGTFIVRGDVTALVNQHIFAFFQEVKVKAVPMPPNEIADDPRAPEPPAGKLDPQVTTAHPRHLTAGLAHVFRFFTEVEETEPVSLCRALQKKNLKQKTP